MNHEPAARNRTGQRSRTVFLVGGLLSLLALAGCAPEGSGAARAAEQFHQALTTGDAAEACSMLSEPAFEKAESDGGCESQLEGLQLPEAGGPVRTEVYGRNAMVEFDNDTVFLAAASSGWQITGAGCTSQGEYGYMCEVGGK